MKKMLALLIISCAGFKAQLLLDFESFTLSPNSAYSSTTSAPFQAAGVSFNHKYAFNSWSEGFAYTNKYDSTNGTFNNLYGVRPYKGRNQSAIYAMGQYEAVMMLSLNQATVSGMYLTNSTYAYKVIRDGNAFSRKFGDTTGTGSGTTIPQGQYPDYFRLIIKGYNNGVAKPDSTIFYLADFRSSNDYIVDTWQFVNTSAIGEVDSLRFYFQSSDKGQFGINTPLYFGLDDISIALPNPVGIASLNEPGDINLYPVPFSTELNITGESFSYQPVIISTLDGRHVYNGKFVSGKLSGLDELAAGLYLLELDYEKQHQVIKIIKN